MKDSSEERRDHPRTIINLPAHFEIKESGGIYPGIMVDASRSGLLIKTLKEMPVGTKLDIEVLPPGKLNLPRIRAEAEIIWKDVSHWEDWEGFAYGLKITHISNENDAELSCILSDPSCLQEAYFSENPPHHSTLILKTK